MILLAIVALGFTFGMPKLMENSTSSYTFPFPCLLRNMWKANIWFLLLVDPEMREEFEKQSRASPISGGARSAMAGGGGPGNFDLAGWMAGTAPGPMGNAETAAQGQAQGQGAATGRERGGATRRRG